MRRSLLGPVPDLDLVQGGRRLFAPPMDPHGLNSIAVFRVGFLLPNGSYIYPNGTEEELRVRVVCGGGGQGRGQDEHAP
jgi:hypothetical protein